MQPSSRTPEGEPNRCPVCCKEFRLDPSRPPGDAPCPNCGSLAWFGVRNQPSKRTDSANNHDFLFGHACRKIDEGKFDLAIGVLHILTEHAPQHLDYRKALWRALKRKRRVPKVAQRTTQR